MGVGECGTHDVPSYESEPRQEHCPTSTQMSGADQLRASILQRDRKHALRPKFVVKDPTVVLGPLGNGPGAVASYVAGLDVVQEMSPADVLELEVRLLKQAGLEHAVEHYCCFTRRSHVLGGLDSDQNLPTAVGGAPETDLELLLHLHGCSPRRSYKAEADLGPVGPGGDAVQRSLPIDVVLAVHHEDLAGPDEVGRGLLHHGGGFGVLPIHDEPFDLREVEPSRLVARRLRREDGVGSDGHPPSQNSPQVPCPGTLCAPQSRVHWRASLGEIAHPL